ncbi:9590_t:CDS:10, partial [Entrophospora sp. SA101]
MELHDCIEFEPESDDIRLVVGVDFGTTFSGFSYAYIKPEKEKIEIVVNQEWGHFKSPDKTNTVLQYDESYEEVVTWGADALSSEPSRRRRLANKPLPRPVEYFKFYLGNVPESKKPKLPPGITFDKAITDYLREMVINKILKLIEKQLSKCSDCSVMFLVGGFSESKYLQSRIKQKFEDKLKIAIPPNPITAIVKGACEYGLDRKIVRTRVLLWSYGIKISDKWQTGDPLSRKTINGRIYKFSLMARKGTEVNVNKEFSSYLGPINPNQTSGTLHFFYTTKYDATYCDEPEVKELGSFDVDMPDTHLGLNRSVQVTLHFGSMEIVATAKNRTTATDNNLHIKKAAEISNLSDNNEKKKDESEGSNNELELERKKVELESKNNKLEKEAIKYQSATSFQLGIQDSNSLGQLSKDIRNLHQNLDKFCGLKKELTLMTSKATSTKLRQQIYGVLGNRGFSNIVVGKDKKHPLITTLQKDILDLMNCYRTITNPNNVANWKIFEYKTSINTIMMNASWDGHDLEDLYVDICAFPIIGFNLCEADKVDKNLK